MTTEQEYPISFLKKPKHLFGTLDHKEIGLLYIFFAFINIAISGWLILQVRTELFNPGIDFIKTKDYPSLFSVHGLSMIFLVVMPMGAGFGNYIVPKMIGAKDLYWPKWNNFAFWMLTPAAYFIYSGNAGVGWTFYPPLSTLPSEAASVNTTIVGLLFAGTSSVIGAINFLLTISMMRKPGLGWFDLDLFSWSIVFTSLIQMIATPFITTALVMLLLTNATGATFFLSSAGSGPILFQHIFWSYSHPAVYIMILPSMGLTSVIIERFAQKKIFGYKSMVYSMAAIGLLGFVVWGHHMFTVTIGTAPNWIFTFTTFLIAIPSGIKTFNWLTTLYKSRLVLDAPVKYALGFLIGFVLGGISGVMVNTIPIDVVYQDTYFVVGHFHFIIIGGAVSTIMGTLYMIFPDATGRMYNRKIANIQWLIWMPSFIITFMGMNIVGAYGMPRRYIDYNGLPNTDQLTLWHRITTIGAFGQAIAFALMFFNFFYSYFKGAPATEGTWKIENPKLWEVSE